MTLYECLGLKPSASAEEIARAGKRKVKETHPDAGGKAEDFHAVTRALTVLRDPVKRQRYDETGEDDDAPEDLATAQAMTIIAQKLMGLVSNPAVDPARLNVVAQITNELDADARNIKAHIAEKQRLIGRMQAFARRISRKKTGDQNALSPMIQAQIGALEAEIRQAEQQLRVCSIALEMVEGYVYAVDAPDPRAYNQGTQTTRAYFFTGTQSP